MKLKANSCEFGSVCKELIRDKIVFTATEKLKERLLREPDLTLEKAVQICQVAEVTATQLQTMTDCSKQVYKMSMAKKDYEEKPVQTLGHKKSPSGYRHDGARNKECSQCGIIHKPQRCPAFGKTCYKCGKKNHFANMCVSMSMSYNRGQQKHQVYNLELHSLFIGELSQNIMEFEYCRAPGWYADVNLRGLIVKFKLDTGAEANVLPIKIFNELPGQKVLTKSETTLVVYGGVQIKPLGTIVIPAYTGKREVKLLFYVTDISTLPLLSREACEILDLVRRVDVIRSAEFVSCEQLFTLYSDVFEGLGEFEGPYHTHVDTTIPPVIHGCRKVPFVIQDRLKETLEQMENAGVITKVVGPTDWVNSLVITEKKNGKLCICLDPCDLNKAVRRQHYTIPMIDDVLGRLAGMNFFTIVDEKDGYWQVKLDEPSSRLCTFNTPWGRHCFNCLPFGLKSSSDVFQQKNEETFGHIKGVYMIADDMIIAARTSEEHNQILHQVMETARAKNIKFNKEKIQFKVDSVKYMGHIVYGTYSSGG
ncbi:uncharacterized protein K02A2.6-like [Hemicordylus capensis]|uniref:uncharacterized protein K02A2.6-like n=1 Tax=Hemicordylus capensis TaxID=884348 RepID=UPI002303B428|nr:uncharacterized protein K02A2.6-like [Hemicordylus capensis]